MSEISGINEKLQALANGQELSGFFIKELTLVFKTDKKGIKVRGIGCLADNALAEAYSSQQDSYQTKTVFVLSNGGELNFIINTDDEAIALDSQLIKNNVNNRILEKVKNLTEQEKIYLGLPLT